MTRLHQVREDLDVALSERDEARSQLNSVREELRLMTAERDAEKGKVLVLKAMRDSIFRKIQSLAKYRSGPASEEARVWREIHKIFEDS